MLTEFKDYCNGSIDIEITGAFIERFLNGVSALDISLTNIKNISANVVSAKLRPKDFRHLKKPARQSMCKIHITKKRGLPFAIRPFLKRYVLYTGAIMLVVILFVLSRFIWSIDINGCKTIDKNELLTLLSEHGIKQGALKSSIGNTRINDELMLEIDKIAFVSVNIDGSKCVVNVKERENEKPDPKPDIPCDIISNKTGIISKIDVRYGEKLVQLNQTVTEGQLLIGGVRFYENAEPRYFHSDADILLRTWYTFELKTDRRYYEKVYKKNKNFISLIFGNTELPLTFGANKLPKFYEKQTKISKLSFENKFDFPILLEKHKIMEYNVVERFYTEDEVIRILEQKINAYLAQMTQGGVVKSAELNYSINERTATVTGTFECEEPVGIKVAVER